MRFDPNFSVCFPIQWHTVSDLVQLNLQTNREHPLVFISWKKTTTIFICQSKSVQNLEHLRVNLMLLAAGKPLDCVFCQACVGQIQEFFLFEYVTTVGGSCYITLPLNAPWVHPSSPLPESSYNLPKYPRGKPPWNPTLESTATAFLDLQPTNPRRRSAALMYASRFWGCCCEKS